MTSPVTEAIVEELLQAKFEANDLKSFTKEWTNKRGERKSAGPLTYVEDETVMDRLDMVLGVGHWATSAAPISDRCVLLTLRVQDPKTSQWVEHQDFGYCTNDDSPEPLKEAWTDAFRRTARLVGVARYVYAGEVGARPTTTTQGQAIVPASAPAPVSPQAVSPQPAGDAPEFDPPTCPNHGYPWTVGQYGPYCKSKARDGEQANQRGYCSLRPARVA